ncbi:MAG: dTDP-4-dehydrorhamnose 3,5-epimerase [Myxococcota bacterium]
MGEVEATALPEVRKLHTRRHGDARGAFEEVWRDEWAEALGLGGRFVQHNRSLSAECHTLRGLHYQLPPKAQGKLVRVVRGAVQDVAVDVREGSRTFGQHVLVRLDAATPMQLWVPPGFAHGFLTLEPDTEIHYLVTATYGRELERGLRYDDPALGIDWAAEATVINARDASAPLLSELPDPMPPA